MEFATRRSGRRYGRFVAMNVLRHAVCLFSMALSLGCAGCTPFTQALWGTDEDQRKVVVVEERRTEGAAEVVVEPLAPAGLWVRGGESGQATMSRWLRPDLGADLALELLAGRGGIEVQAIRVRERHDFLDDRLASGLTEVELELHFDADVMMAPVAAADVNAAALAAMAPIEDNAFVPAASAHLPGDLAFCIQQLRSIDLAICAAAPPGTMRADAFVFVAVDGTPRHHAEDTQRPLPAAASFGERRAALRDHRLLLRVRRGDVVEFWQVRSDLLFLWQQTEGDGHVRMHRSRWFGEPGATQARQPTNGGTWLAAILERHEIRSESRLDANPLLVRILLTPFALALDAACTLVAAPFLGDDDDEGDEDCVSSTRHGSGNCDDDGGDGGLVGSGAARLVVRARDRIVDRHRAVGASVGRAFAGGPLRRLL